MEARLVVMHDLRLGFLFPFRSKKSRSTESQSFSEHASTFALNDDGIVPRWIHATQICSGYHA